MGPDGYPRPPGAAVTGQHINTGCGIVRHLVDTLSKSGNNSVFGLIDWDGENKSSSRVFVLAEGRRNGLENVILDPLLIATTIVGTERGSISKLGIPNATNYPSFLQFTPSQLQATIDKVQEGVLRRPLQSKTICKYLGNFTLEIDEEYLVIDDHKLEAAVLAAFPGLRAYSKDRAGALMLHVAKTAIKDNPKFVPIELFEILLQLLNQPNH